MSNSLSLMTPAALYMEYSRGQAWPLLKTKWSLLGFLALFQSYFRYLASSTAIRSAADMDEVGWPDPAAVVQRMLSTRNCCPSSCRSGAAGVALWAFCVTSCSITAIVCLLGTPAGVGGEMCSRYYCP